MNNDMEANIRRAAATLLMPEQAFYAEINAKRGVRKCGVWTNTSFGIDAMVDAMDAEGVDSLDICPQLVGVSGVANMWYKLIDDDTPRHSIQAIRWIGYELNAEGYDALPDTERIDDTLCGYGMTSGVAFDGGNTVTVLHSVAMRPDDSNIKLVSDLIDGIRTAYDGDYIRITEINPSGLVSIGNMTGASVSPENVTPTDRKTLEAICAMFCGTAESGEWNGYDSRAYAQSGFVKWIAGKGIEYTRNAKEGASVYYMDDNAGRPMIIAYNDGRMAYVPRGNDAKRSVREYVDEIEHGKKEPETNNSKKTPDTQHLFWDPMDIIADTSVESYVPTGYRDIDSVCGGFLKGGVTVVTGYNGGGKSSWISQCLLNAMDNGYKTALISAEMSGRNVLKWMSMQAGGTRNVHCEGGAFYSVNSESAVRIAQWLRGRLFIYKNSNGLNYEKEIKKAMDESVAKKVDVIVIDNMTALNIGGSSSDAEWQRQTEFMADLKDYSLRNNVAIVLVVHPHKYIGFLTKNVIGGSGHITDLADTILTVSRVDDVYKKGFREFYALKDSDALPSEIENADTVIHCMKARETGIDEILPLTYTAECKRFATPGCIAQVYGWETRITDKTAGVIQIAEKEGEDG